MPFLHIIWDLENDPKGNVRHIAEHGVSSAEVVEVLQRPISYKTSRSTGRPVVVGTTSSGRTILVVYEEIDEDTAYPVTAYALED